MTLKRRIAYIVLDVLAIVSVVIAYIINGIVNAKAETARNINEVNNKVAEALPINGILMLILAIMVISSMVVIAMLIIKRYEIMICDKVAMVILGIMNIVLMVTVLGLKAMTAYIYACLIITVGVALMLARNLSTLLRETMWF